MPATWRLLRSGPGAPAFNLALDEALLRSSDDRPLLRLYAWQPHALSLGYFQPLRPFVAPAAAAGLQIVRRPTGGGAIHHGDELTFSLVATPGRDGYPAEVVAAYAWAHAIVGRGLLTLGVASAPRGGDAPLSVRPRAASLCFQDTTALDLVDGDGRKLVGSAQRRRGARVLHHGSIPLTVPGLSPGSGALCLAAGRAVTWDEVALALTDAFAAALPAARWIDDEPTSAERAAAERLVERCYAEPSAGPRGRARDGGP